MNIVWLDAASSWSHASLALPLLHANATGHAEATWYAVETTIASQPQSVAVELDGLLPDVLLASVYLFNRDFVLAVIARLAALRPRCRILLGGPEFLGPNADFLRAHPEVAAVVRGEGEEACRRWLENPHTPVAWAEIPGLCWLDANGGLHDNGAAMITDLHQLAIPAVSHFFAWNRPFVQLETSRGCAARCGFCTSAGVPVRLFPLANIRQQLGRFRAHRCREVRILDRTFNQNARRGLALLDLFLDEFPEMRFHLEIHPGLLGQALRRRLAAAPPGRLHIEAGLQTMGSEALAATRRGGNRDKTWQGLEFLCACRNLEVHVDLLAGLPAASLEQLWDDLLAVAALGPAEIQLETLKILPGTSMRASAAAMGLVFSPAPPYEVLRTPQMPPADLETARLLSRLIDQFYNQAELQDTFRAVIASGGRAWLADFLERLRELQALEQPASLERRFRLLYEAVAGEPRFATMAASLAGNWLALGLSPEHGLVPARRWKEPIPGTARLTDGVVPTSANPGRIWYAELATGPMLFVFDRNCASRRATAIYSLA